MKKLLSEMDLLPPVFGALRKDMMEIDPSIAQPEDLTKRILLSKSYDLRLIATKNEGYPRDTGRVLSLKKKNFNP